LVPDNIATRQFVPLVANSMPAAFVVMGKTVAAFVSLKKNAATKINQRNGRVFIILSSQLTHNISHFIKTMSNTYKQGRAQRLRQNAILIRVSSPRLCFSALKN
jgi:hypothetical protein